MDGRRWLGLGIAALVVLGTGVLLLAFFGVGLGGQESVAYLDVQRVDGPAPGERTVEFSALSPGQQGVFEDALDAEDHFVEIPDAVDRDVWVENRYVRYRGGTYHVAVAVS